MAELCQEDAIHPIICRDFGHFQVIESAPVHAFGRVNK